MSHSSPATSPPRCRRRGPVHELFEINADIQLEGQFEAAYEAGDNRKVIATDSIKNAVYVLAKENRFEAIEELGLIREVHLPVAPAIAKP